MENLLHLLDSLFLSEVALNHFCNTLDINFLAVLVRWVFVKYFIKYIICAISFLLMIIRVCHSDDSNRRKINILSGRWQCMMNRYLLSKHDSTLLIRISVLVSTVAHPLPLLHITKYLANVDLSRAV